MSQINMVAALSCFIHACFYLKKKSRNAWQRQEKYILQNKKNIATWIKNISHKGPSIKYASNLDGPLPRVPVGARAD